VSFLIVMVLLLVVMYVLMIRPQRQRQRQQQTMIEGAGVGDDVLTTGGIYGTVTEAEGDDVVVEIAPGLQVHMTRRGIAAVLPPDADVDPDVVDAEPMEADASPEPDDVEEADEGVVTDGEEPVMGDGDADTVVGDRR
jgi:preprotein translocase subunit YajC